MFCETGYTYVVGEEANVTVVINNKLNSTDPLHNVSLTFQAPSGEELNITNLNNVSQDFSDYNAIEYFLTNATEPLFWWNNTYVNASWALFEPSQLATFWFVFNCTTPGQASFSDFTVSYYHNNEKFTIDGESTLFNINEIPTTSRINIPIRGDTIWYWWLAGGILLALPFIIIIIVRITLWKR